jgi:hypothetical protein
MTSYLESPTGLVIPRNGTDLTESDSAENFTVLLMENRIRQLELQLDEQGWSRIDGGSGGEFSRDGLRKIVELARVHYLKNPLIKRAVEVGALYVWGQDLTINAADEDVQAVIDRFWADNRATLTGQQASRLNEVELQVTGNVFLALFRDQTTGSVRVRGVPVEEIMEIVSNPEDRTEVRYFRREWMERPVDGGQAVKKRALYPDWRYDPADKPDRVGELEVRWESPVLHLKAGAFPHWRWGVPEVYAALDWARAYKEQLEDDATRSRALARFAWRLTTEGGRASVQAAKTRLASTLGANGGGETNPPPVSGSTFVGDKSVGLDPIRIAGATLDPDHSRPARLMASAALGIPDHFFDADIGNYATSKTLDRPTELRFAERRQFWRDILTELCQWAIDADLAATRGLLSKTVSDEERSVELSWPDLLERSTTERVQAIVDAATLAGKGPAGTMAPETVSRLLLVALGVEDVDAELMKLDDEGAPDEEREGFVNALREVREAARALAG